MTARWFDELGVVSMGAQVNGPEDHGLGTMKQELWQQYLGSVLNTHCKSIDHYAIALRIGGKFGDFAPERTHRVRRQKKLRPIGCDVDIPVEAWRRRTVAQLPNYLVNRVHEALSLMVARLQHDGEIVDAASLFERVDLANGRFLSDCAKAEDS